MSLPPACARCGHEAGEVGQLWRIADRLHLCVPCIEVGARWCGRLPPCRIISLAERRRTVIDMAALPAGKYEVERDGYGVLRPVPVG